MSNPTESIREAWTGDIVDETHARGRIFSEKEITLGVASVVAGAAVGTIQAIVPVPYYHRIREGCASFNSLTAVSAGTDPAIDIYRHHPVPTAPTVALASPAAAGNIEDGAHMWAVTFVTAAGETTPSPVAALTIADKTVNGKALVTIPIGPTGTTQRKIYRTEAAGTALKLLTTVANNTATTYLDNIADGSLTTGAPTANTAAATILSATKKLSVTAATGADQVFVHQPLDLPLAAGVAETVYPPCSYSLRAVTGASTGALGGVNAVLFAEKVKTFN